jgi:hypothetical protein
MHYLDITLGEDYLYNGRIVKCLGTRVRTQPDREDTYFVKIQTDAFTARECAPHELRKLPRGYCPYPSYGGAVDIALTPTEIVMIMEALGAYWEHPRCIKNDFRGVKEKFEKLALGEITP